MNVRMFQFDSMRCSSQVCSCVVGWCRNSWGIRSVRTMLKSLVSVII